MESNSPVKYALDAGLTTRQEINADTPILNLQLLDEDGNPIRFPSSGGGTQLQPATKTTLGGVKMANAIGDPSTTTIGTLVALEGDTVNVDQVNQIITQLNTVIGSLNEVIETQKQLLSNLRGSGVIDASA